MVDIIQIIITILGIGIVIGIDHIMECLYHMDILIIGIVLLGVIGMGIGMVIGTAIGMVIGGIVLGTILIIHLFILGIIIVHIIIHIIMIIIYQGLTDIEQVQA